MDTLLIIWIALCIIFIVIEVLTAQIVTIWFAAGSIGAIIANVAGANETIQFITFVAISILALIIARPYLKKFTKTGVQPTNADMCIGQKALVTEKIDNILGSGQVKINGLVWTARSADGSAIEEGSLVTIAAIEGVKLIVTQKID